MPAILEGPSATGSRALSVEAVADKLGISPRQVWKLLATDAGFPRPRKLRSSTRWLESEVDAFLAALPASK